MGAGFNVRIEHEYIHRQFPQKMPGLGKR
jgi:hypothetical protein